MDLDNTWNSYIRPLAVLVGVFILAVVIIPLGFMAPAHFDFDMRTGDYGTLFAHLFIVAVVVERFIEVYNTTWRRPGRIELESRYQAAAGKAKVTAEAALNKYRARTGMLAMYAGFALGLIIAAAGVRTLGVLFDISELGPLQVKVFKAIDVLITSGLIAGGSKGINAMTSLLETSLISSKERMRMNTLQGK